jgi:PAS domain S-box-containing protein/putative nucleotidyltransferase with HDIG domain
MNSNSIILIVDDEPTGRATLSALLANQGYHLALASSGAEALQQATSLSPDLILLDVMMPGMDGFEVCQQIRAIPHLADVPIVLVTALDDRDSRLQGIDAGADDFISKPFDRIELRARIRTITRLNRARRLLIERMKFERVVNLSPNGIMIVDADGTICLANPAMFQMLDAEGSVSLIGAAIGSFIAREHLGQASDQLSSVLANVEQIVRFETVLIRADGEPVPVEVDAGYFAWDAKGAAQIVVRDITERKQVEARTQRQIEHLAALRTIDSTITSSLDLTLTLNIILDQAIGQLQVDAAAVLLRKPHTQILEYAAIRGFHKDALHQTSMHIGEGCAGYAALTRRIVRLPAAGTADGSAIPPLVAGFSAYYGVPLVVKGQVEGVLELFHRTSLDPDSDWLNFLETLAGQAAVAIDHATLLLSMQSSTVELMRAYDTTLEGWVRALDLRDEETAGHSQRVTDLTVQLARQMGMSEAELAHVRRGALLHDIGKMGIPDSILLKRGPLDEAEWAIMRQHPVYAYELLAPVAYLRPALDIPYCHHEKWDGTGYPRGLKGEQIPLAARIFAIADVWDALRSDRPYRKRWPEAQVLEHIRSLAGTHFAPQVVEVFLRLILPEETEARSAILIVDDDRDVAEALQRALCDLFNVFIASSGEVALEILAHEEIGVILTDQRMPGLTGVQLLAQAKRVRPAALGILFSGFFDNGALTEALNLGTVRGFIHKPWTVVELRHRVSEVVQQYSQH